MPGFACHTIEPTALAIPAGLYQVRLTDSERVRQGTLWSPGGKQLPLLIDVPGRTGIRIHSGNTAKDSVGCILVGSGIQGTTLSESRRALAALVAAIENGKTDTQIEVCDGI